MTTSLSWLHSASAPLRESLGSSTFSQIRHGFCCRKRPRHHIYVTTAFRPDNRTRLQTMQSKIWLPNEQCTYNLGCCLAKNAQPGDVLLLHGELGSGKTGVARGYIHTARRNNMIEVTSPTYLLTNVYPPESKEGNLPAPAIYHMDLWRLESASDRPLVDFEQVFTECISLIEWPERLKDLLPARRLDIILEYPPPVQQYDRPDESDPWGFGTGGYDDTSSSRSGRFVSLNAHGDTWRQRVEKLLKETAIDEEGRRVLPTV